MTSTQKTTGKPEAAPKKRLGYGYFIAAVIFLANPCLNIIDILPDFLGYMFLLKGLEKWADLCPNVRDAVTGISKLRFVMLLKLLALFLVPIVDETYVLVLTFAFAVIELIFALPAAWRVYDGLEYFGTRFDGKLIFKNLKEMRTLTTAFFIVKSAFCLFPELCELSSYEYSGYITSGPQIDPASFKNPLIVLNLLVCSAMGFIWLITHINYTSNVFRDSEFLCRVLRDYDLEIGNDVGLAVRRTLRSATTFLIAGFAFFPSLWIDGINVIPTFVGAAFLIAALWKLSKVSNVQKSVRAVAVVFTVVSAISFLSMIALEVVTTIQVTSPEVITEEVLTAVSSTVDSETASDALRRISSHKESNTAFIIFLAAGLTEHILMAVCTSQIFKELRRLVRQHLSADPDITDKRLIDIYKDTQREAIRAVTAGQVIFTVALVLSTVYGLIRTAIAPSFYLIPLIALGIWLVYMINILNSLYEQIEYKYM